MTPPSFTCGLRQGSPSSGMTQTYCTELTRDDKHRCVGIFNLVGVFLPTHVVVGGFLSTRSTTISFVDV